MLVTRHLETEPTSHWSFSKFETTPHKTSTPPPRMSNHLDAPTSTQPEWPRQYAYVPSDAINIFSQQYEASNGNANVSHPRPTDSSHTEVKDDDTKKQSSPADGRYNSDSQEHRRTMQSSAAQSHDEQLRDDLYTTKPMDSGPEGSSASAGTTALSSMTPNPLSSASSAGQGSEPSPALVKEEGGSIKEEEEDVLDDDDDMEGDGEAGATGQTAAERSAQRRKMKRFRLTHQQTRFLMSEFAKQPHPDAAHRERLSREIPGLSPRQVQVWFQNRRAKIKRLTADDRDRMIKMRAVPDDFDNVQALHSPYGAVQGLQAPVPSPVDFGNSAYAEQMMRPLMVDVRRSEGDEHMPSTGLSPAFGSLAFNASANMSSPDVMNPLSPSPGDHRYGYGNHMSSSMGQSPRPTNTFARQTSLDSSMLQNRQQARPLQPLHLRDTLSRSRSESLNSPLRSGMSWKGDSIDYTTYAGGNTSPSMSSGQQSTYQSEQLRSASSTSGLSYGSGHSMHSPPNINYSSYQPSSLQQSSQSRLRNRAASATLPLGLDLRNQYRPMGATLESPTTSQAPNAPRDVSSAAATAGAPGFPNTSGAAYSAGFPSAPLTAPMEFSLPRTPVSGAVAGAKPRGAGSMPDYAVPQMSAPIAPPHDFAQAFQGSASRTPMRESFGAGGHQAQEQGLQMDPFAGDFASALDRKRSFTMSGGTPTTEPGTHS